MSVRCARTSWACSASVCLSPDAHSDDILVGLSIAKLLGDLVFDISLSHTVEVGCFKYPSHFLLHFLVQGCTHPSCTFCLSEGKAHA